MTIPTRRMLETVAAMEAQSAREVARRSEVSSDKSKKNLEHLYWVVHAMWELLGERAGLTDADLEDRIREIDLRDGRIDGQDATETAIQECRNCGKAIPAGQVKCQWCGAPTGCGAFGHAR